MLNHPRIPPPRISRLIGLVLLALLSTACELSLAGDITPPPGYQAPPRATSPAATPETIIPAGAPDPSAGAAIYAERCAPCHGEAGLGDGPQAAQLPNPPTAIGDPQLARQAVPTAWFTVVTRGDLERFMPPFGNSLSEEERWDVVAHVFTLSTTEERLAEGQALFQAHCADCHGESGRGGEPGVPDLAAPATLLAQSAADLYEAIARGVPPEMPAFGEVLEEPEVWAISDYLRSLAFAAPTEEVAEEELVPTQRPAETTGTPDMPEVQTVEVAGNVGTVSGRVFNGSGGEVPVGLQVTLHGYDNMVEVYSDTVAVESGGVYTFHNVEMPEGRVFLTTLTHGGTTFGSEVALVQSEMNALSLPITIYQTSADASALVVDRLHVFLEFDPGGFLQVTELYLISNPTDRVIVPPEDGEPLIRFSLPQEATNLQFQDGSPGSRFVLTEEGFGDTAGVRPGAGQHQVLFAYNLPFDGEISFQETLPLPVSAVILLVPENGVRIRSEQLGDEGVRDIQGQSYRVYTGEALAAGDTLSLTMTGQPRGDRAGLVISGSPLNLVIGLSTFGLVLVLAGVWLFRRYRADTAAMEAIEPPSEEADPESVMDAIIALDDLYRDGDLPAGAYQQRREELKVLLGELIDDPGA